MSTDPAKISDIEQRAQDLQSRQSSMQSEMPMPRAHASQEIGHEHSKGTAE